VLFVVSLALVNRVFRIEGEPRRVLVFLVLVLVPWALVELALVGYLRRNRILECIPKG
jgi:hypothetical protein